ncbi:MAG: hypothetical protein H6728_10875 [Myxococcales bacterium]|nr:hypothetical protein [Myxococcales bacterium]
MVLFIEGLLFPKACGRYLLLSGCSQLEGFSCERQVFFQEFRVLGEDAGKVVGSLKKELFETRVAAEQAMGWDGIGLDWIGLDGIGYLDIRGGPPWPPESVEDIVISEAALRGRPNLPRISLYLGRPSVASVPTNYQLYEKIGYF